MNEVYQTRLRHVLRWMINREYSVADIELALRYIYKVIEAHRELEASDTPESEALARWSLSDAREDLLKYLHAHCAPGGIRTDVVWLSEHTP